MPDDALFPAESADMPDDALFPAESADMPDDALFPAESAATTVTGVTLAVGYDTLPFCRDPRRLWRDHVRRPRRFVRSAGRMTVPHWTACPTGCPSTPTWCPVRRPTRCPSNPSPPCPR